MSAKTINYRHCDVRIELDDGQSLPIEHDVVKVVDYGRSYHINSVRHPGVSNASGELAYSTVVDGVTIERSAPHKDGFVYARANVKVPGYKQSYAVWMDGGLMQVLCN